jgi:hypothetical protein
MTIDVCDPDALPLVPSNVEVLCRTCNTRKKAMTRAQWLEFLAYVDAITAERVGRQMTLAD